MTRSKVIGLVDKIFITFTIFLLVYAWINFFIRDLNTTFVLSVIFTFSVSFILFFLLNRRDQKLKQAKQDLKNIDENFLAFRLMSLNEQLTLINKIISINHNSRIINNSIVFKKESLTNKILFATQLESISNFDLLNLMQGIKNIDRVIIICNQVQPNLNTSFLKNTTIEFVDKNDLFLNYFFPHSIFPNKDILNTQKTKKTMGEIWKNFFIPQKAKSYFLCGIVLIFSSIILPYHYYYLIFGSCLLIASLICKIMPLFRR